MRTGCSVPSVDCMEAMTSLGRDCSDDRRTSHRTTSWAAIGRGAQSTRAQLSGSHSSIRYFPVRMSWLTFKGDAEGVTLGCSCSLHGTQARQVIEQVIARMTECCPISFEPAEHDSTLERADDYHGER
jgi:hypothetical protein